MRAAGSALSAGYLAGLTTRRGHAGRDVVADLACVKGPRSGGRCSDCCQVVRVRSVTMTASLPLVRKFTALMNRVTEALQARTREGCPASAGT